jgi:hypothetical protein
VDFLCIDVCVPVNALERVVSLHLGEAFGVTQTLVELLLILLDQVLLLFERRVPVVLRL